MAQRMAGDRLTQPQLTSRGANGLLQGGWKYNRDTIIDITLAVLLRLHGLVYLRENTRVHNLLYSKLYQQTRHS